LGKFICNTVGLTALHIHSKFNINIMKMYRLLILCLVFGVALGGCKKKGDPAAAAKALCACHEPVQKLQDESKAAAGNQAKLTEIAKKLGQAQRSSGECAQQTIANLGASLKKEKFKSGLLDAMKSECPDAERLYARFMR